MKMSKAPQVQNIKKFEVALAKQQISDSHKQLVESVNLVLIVNPTSAGADTVINKLVETGDYQRLITDTTRPKRVNDGVAEQNGVEYFFISESQMLNDIKQGNYLEAALVHNQHVYGTSIRELIKAKAHGKIAIANIQADGAAAVHSVKPNAQIIFLLPPSWDEWLRRWLVRGEMSQDERLNRFRGSHRELELAMQRDYYKYVINDDLEDAVNQIRNIIDFGDYSEQQHQAGKDLAWHLLGLLKKNLVT